MQINLTKDQYKTLLLLSYLGGWVVNSHKIDERDDEITKLHHHIMKYHKDFSETELVEFCDENGKFYPTPKMDEVADAYISDYNDETFWAELIERLAGRDFVNMHGEKALKKMTSKERFEGVSALAEKYSNEFAMNGLDNINLASCDCHKKC